MILFKCKFCDQNILVIIALRKLNYNKIEYYFDKMQVSDDVVNKIYDILESPNTGFTYSKKDFSIMFINRATSMNEFINTWEHEKNHIEMYLCEKYNINPFSEKASYLSGELAKQLYTSLTNTILDN